MNIVAENFLETRTTCAKRYSQMEIKSTEDLREHFSTFGLTLATECYSFKGILETLTFDIKVLNHRFYDTYEMSRKMVLR